MKTRFVMILLGVLTLACCRGEDALYENGVSRQLALIRKQNIRNPEYFIRFSVPESRDSAISGHIEIDFDIDRPREIIVDFRELDNVDHVSANGSPARYELRNEHIVISSSSFRKGSNRVTISFTPADQSFNRNDDFMYTLLVPDRARTAFPCFDQPDMKAVFNLELEVPEEWVAVSNSPVDSQTVGDSRRRVRFKPTEPLSTYLFSFVAGVFRSETYDNGNHVFTAYHRETDPERLSQFPAIFAQVASSLQWLEDYTGIRYPFAKYDFIILPGFQYGGMEHTGATLYNDTRMFLSKTPTPDEQLSRSQLIAHETAHMWFGDFVTMEWFDDVWTKEVFANYFASRITEPLFPDINHRLNWLKTITAPALSEDRTLGGTAIKQPLDNMCDAGLVYNSIIYNKAPVMLRKLVEIMGEDSFREGIRDYLTAYAYGNASWDDLIRILDGKCEEDLASFSDVWVNSKGMPFVDFVMKGDTLVVSQHDPYGRGLTWPQSFGVYLTGDGCREIEVKMDSPSVEIPLGFCPESILPNSDGRGYGYFRYDASTLERMLDNWHGIKDETCRQSQLMNLHECFQHGVIDTDRWLASLLEGLPHEENALIASTLCGYIGTAMKETSDVTIQKKILSLARTHSLASCRQQLLRKLISSASDSVVCSELYDIWKKASHPLLNEDDYMSLAYSLAIRFPDKQEYMIAEQMSRIDNPDRKRQFGFVSRATTPDTLEQKKLFLSLLQAGNRRIEPWALETLEYLCHHSREDQAVGYIWDALEALPYIQRTSDIFFPQDWAYAILNERHSAHAYRVVDEFLMNNDDMSELLECKILRSAWNLQRRNP